MVQGEIHEAETVARPEAALEDVEDEARRDCTRRARRSGPTRTRSGFCLDHKLYFPF